MGEPVAYAADMATTDYAGKAYWDTVWEDAAQVEMIDPTARGARHYANARLDAMFRSVLRGLPAGARLLEVGCAHSGWLPYFARVHGLRVCGLDYSEHGCDIERQALRRFGVQGDVVCADLFDTPAELRCRFDLVVSFGVVEHFEDTPGVLKAMRRYLKPGGVLVTVIPNMTGAIGLIERVINPAVHAIHVPLSARTLAEAHEAAGLAVIDARFFLSTNFGVLNVNGLERGTRATRSKAALCAHLSRLSKAIWAIEQRTRPLPGTRFLSPYVVCVASNFGVGLP